MRRAMRERPRITAAGAVLLATALLAAGALGAAVGGSGPDTEGAATAQLVRSQRAAGQEARQLGTLRGVLDRAHKTVDRSRRRVRAAVRRNQRLRAELRRVRQALARERSQ